MCHIFRSDVQEVQYAVYRRIEAQTRELIGIEGTLYNPCYFRQYALRSYIVFALAFVWTAWVVCVIAKLTITHPYSYLSPICATVDVLLETLALSIIAMHSTPLCSITSGLAGRKADVAFDAHFCNASSFESVN